MIRQAELYALLYYIGFLPAYVAFGYTLGGIAGFPMLGAIGGVVIGLGPVFSFLPGLGFGIASGVVWIFLVPWLLQSLPEEVGAASPVATCTGAFEATGPCRGILCGSPYGSRWGRLRGST